MFPASKPVISRMLTSIDNEYPCTATDGSRTTLTEEKDKTGGFILTSNVEKDYVLACRVNGVYNSLRTGESGKYPEGNTAWLEHRDTNMTKLYQSVFKNATLSAGVKYKWGGTFACAKIPSIHDVV
ncbi:hypothetical protein [Tetragenococcus halophilus]|uniref:hypothetical protein n=1 Tax=Tetragenococcus halophilus TaxID=51669 RepID=UPI00255DFA8E|nr:hypothetical protein [Tetragenococcus halophilus]GMG66426.1 hypothetical protein TEHIT2_16170 [Tetragenococcus halophilus]